MKLNEVYARAERIIRIAMGKDKYGKWNSEDDPLAAWCGVEAIVSISQDAKPDTSSDKDPYDDGDKQW